MANTITLSGNVIEISTIDTDWNWYDTLVAYATSQVGVPLHSVQFLPGAANDRCVLKNGSVTAAAFFDKIAEDVYDNTQFKFDGEEFKPVLDVSAGVYSADAKLIIILSTKAK